MVTETRSRQVNESCDQCNHPASVTFGKTVKKKIYVLSLCQNHGNRNLVELKRDEWEIIEDERLFKIEDPKGIGKSKEVVSTASEEDGS